MCFNWKLKKKKYHHSICGILEWGKNYLVAKKVIFYDSIVGIRTFQIAAFVVTDDVAGLAS